MKKEYIELGRIGRKLIIGSAIIVLLSVIIEGFGYYYTIQYGYISTIIVSIIVAFGISLMIGDFLARSVVIPIKKLHKATIDIGNKKFGKRVCIKTKDELEELGASFNDMGEKLQKIDEEYKKIDKAKTEFLSITSHELRSPMTPIKARLQMLIQDYFGKLNKEQKESVEVVLRNTDKLDKIIYDLLEISRIETARLKFNFRKVNLAKFLKKSITELNNYLPEKKIKIKNSIKNLPMIETDPDRIEQVLTNLVRNSKKFSPENSKIKINAWAEKEFIFFSVEDEGIGIAKKNQKYLFEPFYQEENTLYRKYGGNGLGLTICKGILESQGGKIWLESDKNKGTKFYFKIPIKPSKEIKPINLSFEFKGRF